MTDVSLIVCSRDRPERLARLLDALAGLDLTGVREVLLVDQSRPGTNAPLVARLGGRLPLVHVPTATAGLSVARNLGVARAAGGICLFTDDDCLPDAGWVPAVRAAFAASGADAVVGTVRPFGDAGAIPVATREAAVPRSLTGRCNPFRIGSGNNMAFRTAVLRRLGGFLEDLGAGTPVASAEDTEMFHRLLRAGGTIAVAPGAIVHHEAWRSEAEAIATKRGYFFGGAHFLTREARRGDGYAFSLLCRRLIGEAVLPVLGSLLGTDRTRRRLLWAQLAGTLDGIVSGLSAPPPRRRAFA